MPIWWAPATAVLTFIALGCARWALKSGKKSLAEAVNEMVSPAIAALDTKLDVVQSENRADHKLVVGRLTTLEAEVERLKHSVIKLQGITENLRDEVTDPPNTP